ncbi:hypothetical protein KW782_04290 [Candidatus Parcubacteria bacterium]|nr:hypothetical protein [Candidatus Parcubacteria bacterium]
MALMKEALEETIETYRENVDTRLRIRQGIFIVIILVLLVINSWNIVSGKIDGFLAASGFLLATIIGLVLSRMFKIFWHEEKERVVAQLDTVGIVLLILYIGVEVGRKWIFEHWLSGAELNSFGLIILSGLILGRFLGTFIKIKKVLTENQV